MKKKNRNQQDIWGSLMRSCWICPDRFRKKEYHKKSDARDLMLSSCYYLNVKRRKRKTHCTTEAFHNPSTVWTDDKRRREVRKSETLLPGPSVATAGAGAGWELPLAGLTVTLSVRFSNSTSALLIPPDPYDLLFIRFQIRSATQNRRIPPRPNMEYETPARAASGITATILSFSTTSSGRSSTP